MKDSLRLIGPFRQLLAMADLAAKGPIQDNQLAILAEAGVLVRGGRIEKMGNFQKLTSHVSEGQIEQLEGDYVCLPGLIDAHTHLCFAGSRARDYAMRSAGKSYLEIAQEGGGIWDTVQKTRAASAEELLQGLLQRLRRHAQEGVTTCEVKSGYGLNVEAELKMLRTIRQANEQQPIDLIPTCLAAHILPRDFQGSTSQYLDHLLQEILPLIQQEGLSNRVDIFIEKGAFGEKEARSFLQKAHSMGFSLTTHADQFHPGGSRVAVEVGAVSADHLEASGEAEVKMLANSDVVAVALPGASLGLGEPFAPVRALLNAGAALAIASDWNPGSAPMGDLLVQAAVLGMAEKLSVAETLAGITVRAAAALELSDRGSLVEGKLADMIAFPSTDYRDILYYQGKMKPEIVWKGGERI